VLFRKKLILLLTHVDTERKQTGIPSSGDCIGWVLDGTSFVVQDVDRLCSTWLPMFFGQTKFSSFTRKLYRWGFRKINVASIPNGNAYANKALFFGNEYFLRSDKSQLTFMRSVTAAKTRRRLLCLRFWTSRLLLPFPCSYKCRSYSLAIDDHDHNFRYHHHYHYHDEYQYR
jgi:HSF-type DNA-binding